MFTKYNLEILVMLASNYCLCLS